MTSNKRLDFGGDPDTLWHPPCLAGNATLAGLPGRELNRLQSVMNAAARLIFAASTYTIM